MNHHGFFIGATNDNINDLQSIEGMEGVCGIKIFMGSSTGDLLVHVNVWTPKTLDKKQRQFFESMIDNEHFDPKPEKSQKSFFDRVKDMFS